MDRDVERRGGLIRDDQFRVRQHRDGDYHTLSHPARELMRIGAQPILGLRNPDAFQHLDTAFLASGLVQIGMKAQHFIHLLPDRVDRVQRGHRVLEDHRDLLAPDLPHPVFGRLRDILARQPNFAAFDLPRRVDQAKD